MPSYVKMKMKQKTSLSVKRVPFQKREHKTTITKLILGTVPSE